jgi:hypothetical protein
LRDCGFGPALRGLAALAVGRLTLDLFAGFAGFLVVLAIAFTAEG